MLSIYLLVLSLFLESHQTAHFEIQNIWAMFRWIKFFFTYTALSSIVFVPISVPLSLVFTVRSSFCGDVPVCIPDMWHTQCHKGWTSLTFTLCMTGADKEKYLSLSWQGKKRERRQWWVSMQLHLLSSPHLADCRYDQLHTIYTGYFTFVTCVFALGLNSNTLAVHHC